MDSILRKLQKKLDFGSFWAGCRVFVGVSRGDSSEGGQCLGGNPGEDSAEGEGQCSRGKRGPGDKAVSPQPLQRVTHANHTNTVLTHPHPPKHTLINTEESVMDRQTEQLPEAYLKDQSIGPQTSGHRAPVLEAGGRRKCSKNNRLVIEIRYNH